MFGLLDTECPPLDCLLAISGKPRLAFGTIMLLASVGVLLDPTAAFALLVGVGLVASGEGFRQVTPPKFAELGNYSVLVSGLPGPKI
jgi:hypothetical protein